MTSKLSDAEVAALLREMGQDIGPVNVATRGVYCRKLERLLLEQLSLSPESPPKDSRQTKTPEKVVTRSLEDSIDAVPETEEDFELDEICDGSLRIEEDEEDFVEEKLNGGRELDGNEFGVKGVRPSNDVSCDRERKFQLGDIHAVGNNHFDSELHDDAGSRKELGCDRRKLYDRKLYGSFSPAPLGKPVTRNIPVLHDDAGSRKELGGGRSKLYDGKLYGSFSPAPLAKPVARNITGDAEVGHLRKRTVALGPEIANDVESYERIGLKPDDYILSPRSPLSTYLERCPPPHSSAPQSVRPTGHPAQPARVEPTKQKAQGVSIWIILATVASIFVLVLLVLYNMEPGYTSPV